MSARDDLHRAMEDFLARRFPGTRWSHRELTPEERQRIADESCFTLGHEGEGPTCERCGRHA
jgi:hypothetical protein